MVRSTNRKGDGTVPSSDQRTSICRRARMQSGALAARKHVAACCCALCEPAAAASQAESSRRSGSASGGVQHANASASGAAAARSDQPTNHGWRGRESKHDMMRHLGKTFGRARRLLALSQAMSVDRSNAAVTGQTSCCAHRWDAAATSLTTRGLAGRKVQAVAKQHLCCPINPATAGQMTFAVTGLHETHQTTSCFGASQSACCFL